MSNFTIKGGIDFDNTKMSKGLKTAEKDVEKFGKTATKFGAQKLAAAFSAGVIISFSKAVISSTAAIANDSAKVGVSTDFYQAWTRAVEEAGGSISNAAGALADLRIKQDEARRGNETSIKAFEGLGITLDQVMGTSVEQLIELVGKAVLATGNFSDAAKVLGTDNLKEVNTALLNIAADGVPAFVDGMKAAGLVLDEELTVKLAEAEKALGRYAAKFKVFTAKVLGAVVSDSQLIKDLFNPYKDTTLQDVIFGTGSDPTSQPGFTSAITLAVGAMITQKSADDVRSDIAAKKAKATKEAKADPTYNAVITQQSQMDRIISSFDEATRDLSGFSPSGALLDAMNQKIQGVSGKLRDGPGEFTNLRRIGANILGDGTAKAEQVKQHALLEKQLTQLENIRDNTAESGPAEF